MNDTERLILSEQELDELVRGIEKNENEDRFEPVFNTLETKDEKESKRAQIRMALEEFVGRGGTIKRG